MDKQSEGQWVVPNPQVPRSFGVMSIVFGALLLLYGAGLGLWTFYAPGFVKGFQDQFKEQLADQKAKRQAKIAELKDKVKAATKEEEKKELETELQALESTEGPDPNMLDDAISMNSDIRILTYTYTELATGILLNVCMIVAGCGLLALAEWARRMAIAIAWLKIARWGVIVGVTMLVIIPITTEKMNKMFTNIGKQATARSGRGGSPFPATSLAQMSAVVSAVTSVATAAIASIYPVCLIWFLTRPRARAACVAASKPPISLLGGELDGP
ncbi:MAG: hypothetical protein ACLQIB_51825 [Isosphaeraceae bacterium]